MDSLQAVVVATDGSDGATAAVERAADLAIRYGAVLHVVSVVDTSVLVGYVHHALVVAALEEESTDAVRDAIDRAEAAGVEAVLGTVLEGRPAAAIADYADDHHADLVVVGIHGRTGLDRLLLGSVSQRVLRTMAVPVLVVPPEVVAEDDGVSDGEWSDAVPSGEESLGEGS